MKTWKGHEVKTYEHNNQNNKYTLYDSNGDVVDVLTHIQFLSSPTLRTLGHGRHRRTNSQNNSGPNRVSSVAGGADPAADDNTTVNPFYTRPRTGLPVGNWRFINYDEEITPKSPLKREGIIAGEIVGYRCWLIEKGRLRSVYQSDIWKPGYVLEGRELGDWNNRGIHAWKDPASESYHDYIRSYLTHKNDYWSMILYGQVIKEKSAIITGSVFLWGDVVEHKRGYRAEFARVRSFDWLYPDESMMGQEQIVLDKLRKLYKV